MASQRTLESTAEKKRLLNFLRQCYGIKVEQHSAESLIDTVTLLRHGAGRGV